MLGVRDTTSKLDSKEIRHVIIFLLKYKKKKNPTEEGLIWHLLTKQTKRKAFSILFPWATHTGERLHRSKYESIEMSCGQEHHHIQWYDKNQMETQTRCFPWR